MSKDTLVKGTLILALAAFVARFLGMVVRIPLLYLLGSEGMASFVIANNIYLVLLLVATAGIPSALSKLISEKVALGEHEDARKIFRSAIWFAIIAGLIVTSALIIAAPTYARLVENPQSALAIQALAPALLLFPAIAMMRGYFQGLQMMTPGGISQIWEQFVRVGTAVLLAYLFIRAGFTQEWAVAGASFGGVLGSVAAIAVMLWYFRKHQGVLRSSSSVVSRLKLGEIYKQIFRLSIPIALISMIVSAVYAIDSSTVIYLLKDQMGLTQATEMLGLLGGKAQPLAGIPPILAIALSASIVPVISSAYAKKDDALVAAKSAQALRIATLSGLPLVLIFTIAARPLNGFLFPDFSGTELIVWMTISAMFQMVMMASGSILMGMGKTTAPMIHVLVGIVVKLFGSFSLAPLFGIYGIMGSTIFCFAVVMFLNLRYLKRFVQFRILPSGHWSRLALVTVLVVISGVLIEFGLFTAMGLSSLSKWKCLLSTGIVSCYVLISYVFLMWKTKIITGDDVQTLPGPIQKALRFATNRMRARS